MIYIGINMVRRGFHIVICCTVANVLEHTVESFANTVALSTVSRGEWVKLLRDYILKLLLIMLNM